MKESPALLPFTPPPPQRSPVNYLRGLVTSRKTRQQPVDDPLRRTRLSGTSGENQEIFFSPPPPRSKNCKSELEGLGVAAAAVFNVPPEEEEEEAAVTRRKRRTQTHWLCPLVPSFLLTTQGAMICRELVVANYTVNSLAKQKIHFRTRLFVTSS